MSGDSISAFGVEFPFQNLSTSTASQTLGSITTNTTIEPYQVPFEEVDVVVSAVLLTLFLVLGVIGNTLTIAVLVSTNSLQRSIFNQFILSLCISDLVSALISWINLYRRTWGFEHFALPNVICLVYWGVDIWTSYVTACHILSFALLRYISVISAHYMKRITGLHAKIWISAIWFVAFFSGCVPMALFSGARSRDRTSLLPIAKWPSCTQNEEWLSAYTVYSYYAYSIFFYIPIVSVVIVSLLIATAMLRGRKQRTKSLSHVATVKRRRKEKQAILQLTLIVGSFLLGYVPFTAFEFYTINSTDSGDEALKSEWRFGTYQYICLRFSECLNPVFYNLGSRPYQLPFTQTDLVVSAVLYILLLVLGVIGNSLTMAVLLSTDALQRSIFNQLILGLCVSDLVSALFSWINLYRRTWGFLVFALPDIVCKVYCGMHIWTSYVTSLHILSFAFLRFVSLTFVNSQILNKITSFHIKIWICIVYFVTFLCGFVPMATFVGVQVRNRTSDSFTAKWPSCTQNGKTLPAYRIYSYWAYPTFFYVPILLVAIFSIITAVVVMRGTDLGSKALSKNAAHRRRRKEKQAIFQLILIVGSFLMAYVPYTLYEIITINTSRFGRAAVMADWRVGAYYYVFLRLSECLNPVFYNLGSSKLRRETAELCRRMFRGGGS